MSQATTQSQRKLIPLAFEHLNIGAAVFNASLQMEAWNRSFIDLLELPDRMATTQTTLEGIIHFNALRGEYGSGDPEQITMDRIAKLDMGKVQNFERVRPDGRVLEIRNDPIENGFILTINDVSERANARDAERQGYEEKLEWSNKRLDDIAHAASDWFWEMGPDYRFTYLSKRFFDIFDVGWDQIIGKTRYEFAGNQEVETHPEKWRAHDEILKQRKPFSNFIYSTIVKDGSVGHIRIGGRPFFDHAGEFLGYRGAGTDVTTEIEAEQALVYAKEVAEKANLAKSSFLSRMSHELRTPLNGILGFSQLLLNNQKEPLTPHQTDFARHIEKAGHHLLELINEILDLAKIESGYVQLSIEPVDVKMLARECVTLIEPLADKKGISVFNALEGMDKTFYIQADFVRVKQVLINLLSNAVKYNRPNGRVWIECEMTADAKARLSVCDTGKGIDSAKHDELFQPFNRLDEENGQIEGSGIGLSITQRLIEQMGGEIGVESEKGKGATFWIEIPLMENQQSTKEAVDEKPADGFLMDITKLGDHRLLYIEDNHTNIRFLEAFFSNIPNLSLEVATSAEEGLVFLAQSEPSLILLDMHLPTMSGLEMLDLLKSRPETKNIPVIALSASAMKEDINQALAAGCVSYETKPLNLGRLLITLCDALMHKEGRIPK